MQFVSYRRVGAISTKPETRLAEQAAIIAAFYPQIDVEFSEIGPGQELAGRWDLDNAIRVGSRKNWTLVVSHQSRLSTDDGNCLRVYHAVGSRLAVCSLPAYVDDLEFKRALAYARQYEKRQRKIASALVRVRMALAAERGATFGTPSNLTPEARAIRYEAQKAEARNFYRPHFDFIAKQRADGQTLAQIAETMNDQGHRTSQGGKFYSSTISRILRRGRGNG